MAQGNLAKLFIAFLVGSAVMAGIASWIGDMGSHYGFTSDSETLEVLVNRTKIYSNIGDAENTTSSTQPDPLSGLTNPWTGAWNAVMNLISAPSTMVSMLNEMFASLFPDATSAWFIATIGLIILSIGIFAVIHVLTGREV